MYQFRAIQERFGKISQSTVGFTGIFIVQFQIGKQPQQLLTFSGCLLYPAAKLPLHGTLFFQDMQFPDSPVHPNAVLPVIGAFIVFGSILYADTVPPVHFALPDSLLDAPDIYLCLIAVVHHLFDAKRREVTLRAARIAQCHAERTLFIPVQRNRRYVFGTIRDVFRRIIRRAVVLTGIDAKYAEIARMTRPHPIVRIPTELAYRGRRCKYQPDIVIVAVNRQPKLIAAIVRIYNSHQSRVLTRHFLTDGKHHRIHRTGTLRLGHLRLYRTKHPFRYILRPQQKADIKLRIRQFLAAVTCHKAVFQIVMLHGRMLLDAAETAMVIRKYQSVFRHDHPRTETAETHYGIFQ